MHHSPWPEQPDNQAGSTLDQRPFRPGHKYDRYATSDLSLFHMSGNAHGMLGPVDNPSEEPPIRAGGQQTEMVSGMTGFRSE